MSRPSWVVFVLPSVSGGSGTVEGLSSAVDSHPVRLRAAGVFPSALLVLEGVQGRLLAIPVVYMLCRWSFFWSFHQGSSSVTSVHLKPSA